MVKSERHHFNEFSIGNAHHSLQYNHVDRGVFITYKEGDYCPVLALDLMDSFALCYVNKQFFYPNSNSTIPLCTLNISNVCPLPPGTTGFRKIYVRLKVYTPAGGNVVSVDFRKILFDCALPHSKNNGTNKESSIAADHQFTYSFNAEGEKSVVVSLMDTHGKLIQQWRQDLNSADENTLIVNTEQLASGLYYLNIQSSKHNVVTSFIRP